MQSSKFTAGRPQNAQAAYDIKQNDSSITNTRNRFRRERLPYPVAVLDMLGIKPGKANLKGYWPMLCPFHEDKRPSLHLHQVTGHFRCFSCGAKGGDILAFYRQATGRSFVEAAKDLGAWEAGNE